MFTLPTNGESATKFFVAAWVVRSRAATLHYFWITHSCLIWKSIRHCLFYNALLQTGLLFMCPIILQPKANVYSNTPRNHLDVHHLVDFSRKCLTVDNKSVGNVA